MWVKKFGDKFDEKENKNLKKRKEKVFDNKIDGGIAVYNGAVDFRQWS